jgi:hypothetical protein
MDKALPQSLAKALSQARVLNPKARGKKRTFLSDFRRDLSVFPQRKNSDVLTLLLFIPFIEY